MRTNSASQERPPAPKAPFGDTRSAARLRLLTRSRRTSATGPLFVSVRKCPGASGRAVIAAAALPGSSAPTSAPAGPTTPAGGPPRSASVDPAAAEPTSDAFGAAPLGLGSHRFAVLY